MANNASDGRIAADIRPPDYRGAVQRIRSLKAKKDKVSSVNGEIADVWAKIEGLKVNKAAGKFFAKLDALEGPERTDVIRSLNGLMDASGWPTEEADLADRAEGNVVHMRVGAEPAKDGGEEGEGGEGGEGGEESGEHEEEPESKRRARRSSPVAGIAAARRHLGGPEAAAG